MRTPRDSIRFIAIIFILTFGFQVLVRAMDPTGEIAHAFLLFKPIELTYGILHLDLLMLGKAALNLVSYMFLHSGSSHLFGNMMYMSFAALGVAYFTGIKTGLKYYILLGILAVVPHYLFYFTSPIPLIGGSGAVFGLMGMFVAFRLKNMFSAQVEQLATIATFVFCIKGVSEVILALMTLGVSSTGTAHLAHVGGFVAGLLLGIRYYDKHYRGWSKRL